MAPALLAGKGVNQLPLVIYKSAFRSTCGFPGVVFLFGIINVPAYGTLFRPMPNLLSEIVKLNHYRLLSNSLRFY